jgi:hypothetical protein
MSDGETMDLTAENLRALAGRIADASTGKFSDYYDDAYDALLDLADLIDPVYK